MKPSRKQEIKKNVQGKKQGRKQKQPGNSTYGPQTPAEAHHAAAARSRAEYAPVVSSIKADREASRQRQKDITGWFGELGGQIDQAAAATDASYNAANAAMQANIDAAAKAAQNANAGVAGANADFAKLTGADPTAFAPSVQEAQAAAGQRSITQAALAAPIAQAGASQAGYLRNTGINARREGIYQRGQESKRQQKIKQDLLAARKERAQKTEANYADTAERERDRGLEKWKVNKAFPLEQQAAALDAKDTAFDNSIAARNAATSERNANTSARNARTTERNSGSGAGGLTPAEKQDARQGRRGAVAAAGNLIKANGVPSSPKEWAGLQALLEDKEEISPTEAAYAVKKMKRRYANKGGGTGTAQGGIHR